MILVALLPARGQKQENESSPRTNYRFFAARPLHPPRIPSPLNQSPVFCHLFRGIPRKETPTPYPELSTCDPRSPCGGFDKKSRISNFVVPDQTTSNLHLGDWLTHHLRAGRFLAKTFSSFRITCAINKPSSLEDRSRTCLSVKTKLARLPTRWASWMPVHTKLIVRDPGFLEALVDVALASEDSRVYVGHTGTSETIKHIPRAEELRVDDNDAVEQLSCRLAERP